MADPFGNRPTPSRRRMFAPRTDRPKRRPLRYRGIAFGSEKERAALGWRRQIILEVPLVLAVALLGTAVNVHHEPGRTIAFALGGVFACVFSLLLVRERQRARPSNARAAAVVFLLALGSLVLLTLVAGRWVQ